MQARLELMSLGKVKAAERNPKTHDLPGITASIRRFGFRDFPTINEKTGRLVEGHGRIKALKLLKREGPKDGDASWPPANVVEKGKSWLVPVVRGMSWDTDEEAAAYLAAHNQLTMATGWDEKELAALLGEINDFTGLGFQDDYIEGLMKTAADDGTIEPPSPPAEFPEVDDADIDLEHKCPKCGFEF